MVTMKLPKRIERIATMILAAAITNGAVIARSAERGPGGSVPVGSVPGPQPGAGSGSPSGSGDVADSFYPPMPFTSPVLPATLPRSSDPAAPEFFDKDYE
jgi:hypothetical protein